MSNIINLTLESLNPLIDSFNAEQVLAGLSKKEIGFLIATPDTGKGYLSLSIAYELATQLPILGVSGSKEPLKTLYWACEDSNGATATRILNHFSSISPEMTKRIQENVSLYGADAPICCSSRLLNSQANKEAEAARMELVEAAKDYDLLIIDTLREAIGTASEVDDDLLVKMVLKEIADKANVAILAVHHLTKAATKGQEQITSVSASGFSTTLATSRLQLLLEKEESKSKKVTKLSHIKGNNLSEGQKSRGVELSWSDMSLVYGNTEAFQVLTDVGYNPEPQAHDFDLSDLEDEPLEELEPKTTFLADSNIPEHISQFSKQQAQLAKEKNDKEKAEYAEWLAKQEQDQK